ncbi:MAG: Threonine--tRNA ligase [Mycoplasmataceae bacterium]|nr:MAG: Threonine--tRNA ligase [Mycoplasmataceae bacterium]
MKENNNISQQEKEQDHRVIAKDLDLYIFDDKIGQGLPILLENWVIIRNKIAEFLREKQKEFEFQEVMTPILGSEYLYKTSGHLDHYQGSMFPVISRNNESFYLRPMTCPHHCAIYQQQPRSYRDLPFRLCENSLLFRYEASGSLKGLERPRWFELADHHIFVSYDNLKEELKRNYHYIKSVLEAFNFKISRLVCALHESNNSEKYHSDKDLWNYSENLLIESLQELGLNYEIIKGEAAFYGPKLDLEIKAADGKNITISTIQLDFILPKNFALNYRNKKQDLENPAIIHQSPIGSYQRFIALMLEQTNGKLPFWLAPCQLAILPLNDEEETKLYYDSLVKELTKKNLRVKIFSKKTLNYRINQIYQKKIPYYLVIGKDELKKDKIKLIYTYLPNGSEEITQTELINKLAKENEIN